MLILANSTYIKVIHIRNRLRWLGQVVRMPPEWPRWNHLTSWTGWGYQRRGSLLLTLTDTIKGILKRGGVFELWSDRGQAQCVNAEKTEKKGKRQTISSYIFYLSFHTHCGVPVSGSRQLVGKLFYLSDSPVDERMKILIQPYKGTSIIFNLLIILPTTVNHTRATNFMFT